MSPIFSIEYPITRTVHWRWIAPISYAGAFIVIVFLTMLNVALVGYETVNVFQDDFNFTQHLWYQNFIPSRMPQPGSLCEPHLFGVGDQLRMVNRGFEKDLSEMESLEWTVVSIESVNSDISSAGFPYSGDSLVECDITRIQLNDLGDRRIPFLLECFNINGYHFQLTTVFNPYSITNPWVNDLTLPVSHSSPPQATMLAGLSVAYYDFFLSANRIDDIHATSILETPCPASLAQSTDCAQKPPRFKANVGNSTHWRWPPTSLDRDTDALLLNWLQTVYALMRLELGIDSPNNVLLHQGALPTLIIQASDFKLYSWFEQSWSSGDLPLPLPHPPTFAAEYFCKFQQLKSPGSLVVSVLVAVLSMFSGGWAIYLFVISSLSKRSRGANMCEAHKDTTYQSLEMAASNVDTLTNADSGETKPEEERPLATADLERGLKIYERRGDVEEGM